MNANYNEKRYPEFKNIDNIIYNERQKVKFKQT